MNAEKKPQKYILIGIHDVTPFYKNQLKLFFDALKKRKIKKISLLLTPNWHEEYNITLHPKFIKEIKQMKEQGAELVLHGYDHKGEKFMNVTESQAQQKLKKAIHIFEQAFKEKPKGFIPPMWKQSKATKKVLKKIGFSYTESFQTLEFFSGKRYKGFPLGMESLSNERFFRYDIFTPFAARFFSNIYARMIWNKKGIVRYSIHPREAENGNFKATLKLLDAFLKRGWVPITYSELEKIAKK